MLQRYDNIAGFKAQRDEACPKKVLLALQLPPLALQEPACLKSASCLLPHRHRSTSHRDARPQRPVLLKTLLVQPVCAFQPPPFSWQQGGKKGRRNWRQGYNNLLNGNLPIPLPAESWPLLLLIISAVFVHCLTSIL